MVKNNNTMFIIIGIIALLFLTQQDGGSLFSTANICTSNEPDTLEGYREFADGNGLTLNTFSGGDIKSELVLFTIEGNPYTVLKFPFFTLDKLFNSCEELFEYTDNKFDEISKLNIKVNGIQIYEDKTEGDELSFCGDNGFFVLANKIEPYFETFYTCVDKEIIEETDEGIGTTTILILAAVGIGLAFILGRKT